jgi:hypothetical protein
MAIGASSGLSRRGGVRRQHQAARLAFLSPVGSRRTLQAAPDSARQADDQGDGARRPRLPRCELFSGPEGPADYSGGQITITDSNEDYLAAGTFAAEQ